jgi:hypothetical protein
MPTKRCFKCRKRKSLKSFYAHPNMADGYLNKCKDCAKADAEARRLARDPEIVREEKRLWAASPNGRATLSRYRAAHMEAARRSNSDWGKRNRDKTRAQCAAKRAVKKGLLIRKPCETCGNPRGEAHHDDYRKPLEVRWLCRVHHTEHHRLLRRTKAA